MIDRNLPELQKACSHVLAVFALLHDLGVGLLSTKASGRVGGGSVVIAGVAFGGERGSVRASVGS